MRNKRESRGDGVSFTVLMTVIIIKIKCLIENRTKYKIFMSSNIDNDNTKIIEGLR